MIMSSLNKIQKLRPLDMGVYTHSFVSGKQQNYIDTQYFFDKETKRFYAKVFFHKEAQGQPQIVHGGAIAAVLDETLGAASFMNGYPAVTASFNITYRIPLAIESEVIVETWVEKIDGKKVFLMGKMFDKDESIIAETNGIHIKIPKDKLDSLILEHGQLKIL